MSGAEILIAVVKAAAEAYSEHQKHQKELEIAKNIIRKLSEKIEQSEQAIIQELHFLNLENLEGRVIGIRKNLNNYVTIPSITYFEKLLFESGQLSGELEAKVINLTRFNVAKEAYPLYITIYLLECIIWQDYKNRFSLTQPKILEINNNLKSSLEKKLVITDKLIDKAREVVNGRFSSIEQEYNLFPVTSSVRPSRHHLMTVRVVIKYYLDDNRATPAGKATSIVTYPMGQNPPNPPDLSNVLLEVNIARINHMEKILTEEYDDIFFNVKEKLLDLRRNMLSLHSLWSKGWTSIVPFTMNGKQYLLLHKDSTDDNVRKTAIEEIKPNLKETSEIWTGQWASGWTSLVPLKKNQTNYLFAYKIDGSKTAIDEIHSDFSMTAHREASWTEGYTNFAPFTMNGNNYLLGYKLYTGRVSIEKINLSGNTTNTEEVWNGNFSIGWTSIVPFTMNQQPHFLLYKLDEGTVEIHKVNPNAQGLSRLSQLWISKWSKGWTSIVPFTMNKVPHQLLYKSWSGDTVISKVKANGNGVTDVRRFKWTPGWTNIIPFESNGQTHLFMYKRNSGTIGISSIKNLI